jgi:hypothetical protein
MEYPVQTQRRKLLEYLQRRRGEEVVVSLTDTEGKEELGLGRREYLSLIRELRDEGYIAARYVQDTGVFGFGSFYGWRITHLTDKGLRELGELPDPHFELMQRLDLAIQQIQHDPRLSEPQKQQTINWLEEGKLVARALTIDAIKAILAGAIQ